MATEGQVTVYDSSGIPQAETDPVILGKLKAEALVSTVNALPTSGNVDGDSVVYDGSQWIYDSGSTDNGGTVINNWVRQYSGAVNVGWFNETETTATVSTAFAIANSVGLVGSITDFEITVGASGDFSTMNEAISQAIKMNNQHGLGSVSAKIKLLAGFIMEEQVFVYGQDLSWIEIYGEDSDTKCDPAFLVSSFTDVLGAGIDTSAHAAFAVDSGALPRLNQLFDMELPAPLYSPSKHGLFAINGGRIFMTDGNGFLNCGDAGALAKSGGHITVRGCNFSGSYVGVFAFEAGSSIDANEAICDNCESYGIYINRCATVNHHDGFARNNMGNNICVIRGGIYNGDGAVLTGCTKTQVGNATAHGAGIYALNGIVNAWEANVSDCAGPGIYAEKASIVNINEGTATGCGGSATLWALTASTIDADGVNASGSLASIAVVFAQRASTINFQSGDATGRSASFGIRCSEMSFINARLATAQISGADSDNDCSVANGGLLSFHDGVGGVLSAIDGVFNGVEGTVYR